MRVAGRFAYDAPPELMYEVFTHPDALRNATPGLQSLREAGPDRWEAEIKVGLGGFGLIYAGTVSVADRRPGEGYRIHMAAKTANGAGAEVEARLRFEPRAGGGTLVAYEADVLFHGGQTLQPAIARGLVEFFLHGIKEYVQKARRRSL
ncbi:MAG: CoxG family protein [Bacillota bacterium]